MTSTRFMFSLIAVILLFTSFAEASTYLDINNDAYNLLSLLEAEGVIRSALLTTRPISRKEALRLLLEAEQNSEGRSPYIKGLVRDLEQRLRPQGSETGAFKPLDTVYATYVNTNADVRTLTYPAFGSSTREKEQALNKNNDGDLYTRGSNERIGFTSRVEDLGRFSFYLNPEFQAAHSESSDLIIKNGYAVLDLGWDLIIGKESQWWGPGQNGALLLTNNAEAFTQVQLTNPTPAVLPWIFKYFGPYRFTFFVTTLEKDRADFSEPYLYGMRVNFKPHPYLEIGLARTALLGGRGRPTNSGTWLNSLTGRGEHCVDPYSCPSDGDQRAGYDLKLTLPFELQPVQLYMEADGEDSAHEFQPRYWAFVYGLYFPRLLSFEPLALRMEYARTFDNRADRPTVWYTHSLYTAGYTYHGSIIGHHMGTDSRDLFGELSWRFPEKNARVSLAFDRTEHSLSFDVNDTENDLFLRTGWSLSKAVDLDLTYGYAWVDNVGDVVGVRQRSQLINGTIAYRF